MEKLQEQIAKRAYELFLARGGQDGYHIQDWLQAEKEMSRTTTASEKASMSAPKIPLSDSTAKVKQADSPAKPKSEKPAPAKKLEKMTVRK